MKYFNTTVRKNWNLQLLWFCLGLLLLPLSFWPLAAIPHEVPKVWLTIVWIMGLGLLMAIRPKSKESPYLNKWLFFWLFLFFAVNVGASFFGRDFAKSVIGNPYRIDGVISLSSLLGLAMTSSSVMTTKNQNVISLAIWVSSCLLSIWAVCSYLFLHLLGQAWIPNWSGSIGVSFGQPNFLAGYVLVTLPFGWWLAQKAQGHWSRLWWSSLLLPMLAIGTTYSWGATAGVGLFVVMLITYTKLKRFWRWWFAATFAAIVIFISLSVFKDRMSFTAESRYRIYTHVFAGFIQRPWLGWGVANVDYAFKAGSQNDGFWHDVYLDKAHSEILEVMATTGIAGLVCYGLILAATFRVLMKEMKAGKKNSWQTALLMVLLLYLYHSQTNVISISEQLLFWVVVGFALSKTERVNGAQ